MGKLIIALLVVAASAGSAFARAPTLKELPTVKALHAEAEALLEEQRAAAEAAAKNPTLELIKDYAAGHVSMREYKKVVAILKSDREEKSHRQAAADALRQRFPQGARFDEDVQRVKKGIALELLPYLMHKDKQIRQWVNGILVHYWESKARSIGYRVDDSRRDRGRSAKRWRDFLTR